MDIQFGTLADWVSGIGGVLAVAAALVAWRVSQKLLAVEQQRDAEAREQRRREQAGLVFALGAKLKNRTGVEEWAVFLYNGSSKPIFDVRVTAQTTNESQHRLLRLSALPPGQFIVPRHEEFYWGDPFDLSLAPEPVELLVKGRAAKTILSVTFVDAAGQEWLLDQGTILVDSAAS